MRLDRRSFLGTGLRAGVGGWAWRAGLGAGATLGSGWVLSACGDDGESEGDFVLVSRFPNTALVPGRNRLAVSIAQPDGTILGTGPEAAPAVVDLLEELGLLK